MRHPRAGLALAALDAHLAAFDAAFFTGTATWDAVTTHLAITTRLAAQVLARQHGRLGARHAALLANVTTLIDAGDLVTARIQLLAALQATRP